MRNQVSFNGKNVRLFLQGGLGNQLFQFTAGLFFCQLSGRDVFLDDFLISSTSRHGEVTTELGDSWHNIKNVKILVSKNRRGLSRLESRSLLSSRINSLRKNMIVGDLNLMESLEEINNNSVRRDRNVLMIGMFQDWDLVRKAHNLGLGLEFDFGVNERLEVRRAFEEISYSNAVGISLRLCDDIRFKRKHSQPSITYFENAICSFLAKSEPSNFLVFTDCGSSGKIFFGQLPSKLRKKIDFFVSNPSISSLERMYLLSNACNGVIATNSTFCHWAAWFAMGKGKRCIAPLFKEQNLPYLNNRPREWDYLTV